MTQWRSRAREIQVAKLEKRIKMWNIHLRQSRRSFGDTTKNGRKKKTKHVDDDWPTDDVRLLLYLLFISCGVFLFSIFIIFGEEDFLQLFSSFLICNLLKS